LRICSSREAANECSPRRKRARVKTENLQPETYHGISVLMILLSELRVGTNQFGQLK
jgi:hypothetical protein